MERMIAFEIAFVYDSPSRKWEVVARGASNELDALQGFNAVLLTARDAIPKVECNRAERQTDGTYKITVGI